MNQKEITCKTSQFAFLSFQTRNRISNYSRSWNHCCIFLFQRPKLSSAQHEHKRPFPWRMCSQQTQKVLLIFSAVSVCSISQTPQHLAPLYSWKGTTIQLKLSKRSTSLLTMNEDLRKLASLDAILSFWS